MQNTQFFTLDQPTSNETSMAPCEAQLPQQPIVGMPQTPVSQGHSRTVPNTPQNHTLSWPSPPPTEVKHARSQSFQLDIAPMPMSFDDGQVMRGTPSPYSQPQGSFTQDSFILSNEQYASSVYSSSNVDPMSPRPQLNMGAMPTVYEEQTPPLGNQAAQAGLSEDALLLQAAAGASDDFNSPNFVVGGGPMGMSPRTAMLNNLGEDVNATIIDTGIPPEVIDMHIREPDPETRGVKIWHCLFPEDGKTCNKWFKRKENARSHVQGHLGDRPYMCNDCEKTFVRQHDMKRHAAIHKDDRPNQCPCGSSFARHDALTRHRQRGMCIGTLPGFEKIEEDKPKRGRPKKERPDEKTRTTKAKKARDMDRETEADAEPHYASSSLSEHSLPVTPPYTSDFDNSAYFEIASAEMMSGATNWRDTPPTSPASAAPTKTIDPAELSCMGGGAGTACASFTGGSSPETGGDVDSTMNFGAVGAQPGVAEQDFFSDAFSPSYGSTDASSPFNPDDMVEWKEVGRPDELVEGGGGLAVHLEGLLDQWLAQH